MTVHTTAEAFVVASLRSLTTQDGPDSGNGAVTHPATEFVITPATRLEQDLYLDSLDLVDLAEALRRRYGEAVDLLGHLTGLGIEELIAFTVGDVVTYVVSTVELEARG